jgi:sec-independent protein translocase protein TatA
MEKIGPLELIIVLVIVIMIFGVGKLPQAAGSLGKAMREFRKESARTDDTKDEEEEVAPKRKPRATARKASAARAGVKKESVAESTEPAKAALPAKAPAEDQDKPEDIAKAA